MEAIRKIITVKENVLNIVLPDNYRDKKIELIILPAEDEMITQDGDFEKFYGVLKSGLTIEEIDHQLKSTRSEWERDI